MGKVGAQGGAGGGEAQANCERLRYDNRLAGRGVEGPGATAPASETAPHGQTQPQGMKPRPDMGNPDVRGQKSPDSQGKGSGEGQSEGGQIAPKQLNQ